MLVEGICDQRTCTLETRELVLWNMQPGDYPSSETIRPGNMCLGIYVPLVIIRSNTNTFMNITIIWQMASFKGCLKCKVKELRYEKKLAIESVP